VRDVIDFDRAYLSRDIRDKLLSLADKTTLDMLTFNNNLAENKQHKPSFNKQRK
jgi:hypothetical protein